jgi:FAD/FMN-containing dehydrogenase
VLYGLTIDNLLEADLVLADGTPARASADENPDLFWAIRGGGGNFGVATSFQFALHPVSTVLAGPTFWPLEQTQQVMRAYREFLPNAPRELNGFLALLTVPPAPPFPEELHFRKRVRRN